jgi:HK97 family phage prohead protease
MKKVTKLFNIDVKSVDEANRQITFCFSDDQEDRMGEIVDQGSWDVKNYMNNPLILFGHDSSIPENILGQGVDLQLNIGGKSFVTAQFDEAEINPRADMVFRQLVKRTLRAVSAGFINHTTEKGDVPVLKDNELLEISIVPIPANPRAIALALQDGSMSRKDALYLKRSMQDELALIEKQLIKSEIGDLKEKDVEELQTQITQLTALVTSVVESVSAIRTDVETLKPVEETEEAKTAREAQEATDKAAADQKVIDDKAVVDPIEEVDTAKDGEIDQSGAEETAIDENAELTPELQAQIDAQLAESMQAKE